MMSSKKWNTLTFSSTMLDFTHRKKDNGRWIFTDSASQLHFSIFADTTLAPVPGRGNPTKNSQSDFHRSSLFLAEYNQSSSSVIPRLGCLLTPKTAHDHPYPSVGKPSLGREHHGKLHSLSHHSHKTDPGAPCFLGSFNWSWCNDDVQPGD